MATETTTRLLAVLGLGLAAACGNDPATPAVSSCVSQGPVTEIVDNHLPSGGDHVLSVPSVDVVIGEERRYDIRGDNVGHTHFVTLTEEHFDSLRRGESVSVTSSNKGPVGFGHDHVIRLSCP